MPLAIKRNSHHSRLTRVNSGEDALHGVRGGVTGGPSLARLVALGTEVKVVTHQTLVALPREAALSTSITAHTFVTHQIHTHIIKPQELQNLTEG